MSEESGHYIHGTDPDEQRWLSLLNGLLNDAFLAAVDDLGARKVADDLVALTELHAGGESQFTDDRTVVVIRR